MSVVGCDVIEERDVRSDEVAEDSRLSTWREDDTNLKQEMRISLRASRGRQHIVHVPVELLLQVTKHTSHHFVVHSRSDTVC